MITTPSALTKKINTSSIAQQVIDALTQAMINKELQPGDKIPTESELSEMLGVGRLSIREAIKVLVYYGVLEIRRPEGTFVREGFSESLIDPLLFGIILNCDESYRSIKELRLFMEVAVIKLAMKKSTRMEKARLRGKLEEFGRALARQPMRVQEIFDVDNEFHTIVSEMGDNPLFDKINTLVRTLTHDLRYETVVRMVEKGDSGDLLQAHEQICIAIETSKVENIEEIVEHGYFYNRMS